MIFWQWSLQTDCGIVFIRPGNTLPSLDEQLSDARPTLAIDLTGGNIAPQLTSLAKVPQWTDLHFSRVRRTDDGSLDTTGHIVSRSAEQIAAELADADASRVLLLDDTSFSGTTNQLAEQSVRAAFPGHDIEFEHGFLIANAGDLGSGVPGAMRRLGRVAAGHVMHTPRDDGWHIFDIVRQPDLEHHLHGVQHALHHPECESKIFAGTLTSDELRKRAQNGAFIANGEIKGSEHAHNPQLLSRIVAAGHVEPIEKWRGDEDEVFKTLLAMGEILKGDEL